MICQGGWKQENKGFLSFFAQNLGPGPATSQLHFRLVNAKGYEVHHRHVLFQQFGKKQAKGDFQWIGREELLDKDNGLLSNDDSLTLRCKIIVLGDTIVKNESSSIAILCSLSEMFESALH